MDKFSVIKRFGLVIGAGTLLFSALSVGYCQEERVRAGSAIMKAVEQASVRRVAPEAPDQGRLEESRGDNKQEIVPTTNNPHYFCIAPHDCGFGG